MVTRECTYSIILVVCVNHSTMGEYEKPAWYAHTSGLISLPTPAIEWLSEQPQQRFTSDKHTKTFELQLPGMLKAREGVGKLADSVMNPLLAIYRLV